MPFGMDDLRRLSGLDGKKPEPAKPDYNMQADSALEKIFMSIDDLPSKVGHYAANMDDEKKMWEYLHAIANSLREAAAKIESGNI